MRFNVNFLLVPTPPIKNKHINVPTYNYFLCTTSSNINLCFTFNYLNKLQYPNSSIIMEYDDFVKFSSFEKIDFRIDPLCD